MTRYVLTAILGILLSASHLFAQLHHFEFDPVGDATAGEPLTITIYAKDALGETITTFKGKCDLTDETGTIVPDSTGSFTSGVWTGDVTMTDTYTGNTITATLGVVDGTSNTFDVNPGPLDYFSFDTISTPQIAGVAFSVTIRAYDAFDNLKTDFGETATLEDVTGTLSPTSAAFSGGQWTGDLTITEAIDPDSVTATYSAVTNSSNTFQVKHGDIDHFEFSTIPSPRTAGTPFTVTIAAVDQYGNRVIDFNNSVDINDVTDTITPSSVPLDMGWWYGELTITQAIDVDSITASWSTYSGYSNAFAVQAGDLDQFSFSTISDPQEAGQPFLVTITAQDSLGNVVEDYTGPASLQDETGTLTPTQTGTFTNGRWGGFLTITQAVDTDFVTASEGGASGTSNTFEVLHSDLHHFGFDPISDQVAGVPFSITISAFDEWSNVVETFEDRVFLDDLSHDMIPDSSGTFTSGVWTGPVLINSTYSNDRIIALGGGEYGQSNAFDVVATEIDHFEFETITGEKTAGVEFSITIYAKDNLGNTVESYDGQAFLTDLTGTISPGQTNAFESGVWTGDVSITEAMNNDRITAEDTINGVSGTSNNFNVVAASIDHFTFDPIGNKVAGQNFSIRVWARDQYENPVESFTSSAQLSDSTGTIFPTTTGPFSNGRADVSVQVTQTLIGEWVEATYQDTITGRSNSFNITPASLADFVFDTISDQFAGVPFEIRISAYDQYGNLKTNFNSTANLIDLSDSIEPNETDPFSQGIWQGEVTIFESYTNDRITASSGGVFDFSNSFDVQAAGLHHFDFSSIPGQVVAGDPFSVTVTARDSLENVVTQFESDVFLFDLTGTYSDTVTFSQGVGSDNVVVTQVMENDQLTAQYGSIENQSGQFDIIPAVPEFLVLSPPDPFSITVGTSQVFTAVVVDPYFNRVPDAPVTFLIKDVVDGALSPNPDDSMTTGNNQFQTGDTDSTGSITVLYTAPEISGMQDILDAMSQPNIPQGEVADVTITSVDSGATRLVIQPEDPEEIRTVAGEVFSIIVEAQDGFGNVDDDDTTLVSVTSSTGAMEFSKDGFETSFTEIEFRLSEGSDTLEVRSCMAADNDTITADDADTTGTFLSPASKSQVFIEPGEPTSPVVLTADPDTLTANGSSTATIQSDAVLDSCGNAVGDGTFVTVTATLGAIISPDQDLGTPGIQVVTNGEGRFDFTIRTGTASGTCLTTAQTVTGDTLGTAEILFQEPPSLTYLSGSLLPNTVSPGDSVSFQLRMRNEGEAGVTLSTATEFLFTDGAHTYRSELQAAVELPGGGDWDTLFFTEERVPDSIIVTSYTPILDLTGIDSNGSQFDQNLTLDPFSLEISNMRIIAVQLAPDTVTVEDSVVATLIVENTGEQLIILDDFGLLITPTGDFDQRVQLPDTLQAGVISYLPIGLKVNSMTPTGTYIMDGFASGTSGGGTVSDNSADFLDSVVVISLATADYVDGSLDPKSMSPGGEYSVSVRVRNYGESSVNLNTSSTVSFESNGDRYEASLASLTTMVGGGAVTELVFQTEPLASDFPYGVHGIDIFLAGQTLNGGEFQQFLSYVDSIEVQRHSDLTYVSGSMEPQKISRGYLTGFQLRVSNGGEATLDLDPSSTVLFLSDGDDQFLSLLDGSGTTSVAPGETTLTFLPGTFPSRFDAGSTTPTVVLNGEFNQIVYEDTVSTDDVLVQVPATISVNAERSDTVVTVGQSFDVEAIVENRGEAGLLDAGTLNLDLSGTDFSASNPIENFGPQLPDTIIWTVTVPDSSSTGIFEIAVEVDAVPHDENTDPPQLALLYQGGRDIVPVSVVEGNQMAVERLSFAGFPPSNVYAGQNNVLILALKMTNRGNAKNEVRLDSLALSLRELNGSLISPASDAVGNIWLSSDLNGSDVLISSNATGTDRVMLDLSSAAFGIGSDPDTLFFFLDLVPDPGVETILLHLGGSDDIFATDLSTGRSVEIVDVLGERIVELESDYIVLNPDDFGNSFKTYPNPFRAGSEQATFSYFLPENASVDISIYTLTGELVLQFSFEAGLEGGLGNTMNEFEWDGRNGRGEVVLNGVYLSLVTARLQSGRVLTHRHKVAVMK